MLLFVLLLCLCGCSGYVGVDFIQNGADGVSSFENVRGVSVSQDSLNVYVSSQDSLLVFRLNGLGELDLIQTVTSDAHSTIDTLGDILVSDDDRHIYVSAFGSDSVLLFYRDTHELGAVSLISSNTFDMVGPTAMAFHPYAPLLVVASQGTGEVMVLERTPYTGELALLRVLDDETVQHTQAFLGVSDLFFSEDGNNLYVSAPDAGCVHVLSYDEDAVRLTYLQTLSNLARPSSTIVSSDLAHAYVSFSGDNTIGVYWRDFDGSLSLFTTYGSGSNPYLNGVHKLAFLPGQLYLAALSESYAAPAVLARQIPAGTLTYVGDLFDVTDFDATFSDEDYLPSAKDVFVATSDVSVYVVDATQASLYSVCSSETSWALYDGSDTLNVITIENDDAGSVIYESLHFSLSYAGPLANSSTSSIFTCPEAVYFDFTVTSISSDAAYGDYTESDSVQEWLAVSGTDILSPGLGDSVQVNLEIFPQRAGVGVFIQNLTISARAFDAMSQETTSANSLTYTIWLRVLPSSDIWLKVESPSDENSFLESDWFRIAMLVIMTCVALIPLGYFVTATLMTLIGPAIEISDGVHHIDVPKRTLESGQTLFLLGGDGKLKPVTKHRARNMLRDIAGRKRANKARQRELEKDISSMYEKVASDDEKEVVVKRHTQFKGVVGSQPGVSGSDDGVELPGKVRSVQKKIARGDYTIQLNILPPKWGSLDLVHRNQRTTVSSRSI
eukprot:Rmarinus@m.22565